MDPQQLRSLCIPAVSFVMARCKESGGFGATPKLPATILDTYHALNILDLSRRLVPAAGIDDTLLSGDKVRAYLAASLRLLSSIGISTAFHLLWACRTAGVAFDHPAVERAVNARMQAFASLEEWYYGARILTEILGREPANSAGGQISSDVLNRGWRCVDEAWMFLYLARVFDRAVPRPVPELVVWLQACQNGDGGFGFFPGTTSFIENCHACLRALAFLGSTPVDLDRAVFFISGCQTASGGFSRGGRAAPFLDATWHALASLSIVSSVTS